MLSNPVKISGAHDKVEISPTMLVGDAYVNSLSGRNDVTFLNTGTDGRIKGEVEG